MRYINLRLTYLLTYLLNKHNVEIYITQKAHVRHSMKLAVWLYTRHTIIR